MQNPVPPRRRRVSNYQLAEWRDGWLFASPFIFALIVLWLGPMLYSLYAAFCEWTAIKPPRFSGLDNIRMLFEDPLVGKSLGNTFYYTFLGIPLQFVVAFALALLLNQEMHGRVVYRTIFYLPTIVPAVAIAAVWGQILNAESGVLNNVLRAVGLPAVQWLWKPALAKPAFIIMSLWTTGGAMVLLLAALQGVPQEFLEAAEIDGAGRWARFWNITVPVISPTILFCMIMGVIGSFQTFTSSFIMTNGGPQNATLFIVLYLYRNAFQLFKMGYASTLAWLVFAIVAAFTYVQFRLATRWVYYETTV
jgi:multiple sugar transport system permease protein